MRSNKEINEKLEEYKIAINNILTSFTFYMCDFLLDLND